MCAVMQLNTPESWKFELFHASHLQGSTSRRFDY
jgi:hypothetical protein